MESFIKELVDALLLSSDYSGWAILVAIGGTLIMFSVRGIKLWIPQKWENLKTIWKLLIPFACAAIGSFGIGLAGAMTAGVVIKTVVGKLVGAAIAAGFAAIAGHHTTKVVGQSMDEMLIKNNPDYVPGTLRKKMSLLVDIPDIDKAKKKNGIVD